MNHAPVVYDPAAEQAVLNLKLLCKTQGWSFSEAKRHIVEELRVRQHMKLRRAQEAQYDIFKDQGERKALGDNGYMEFQIHPDIYYHWVAERGPDCWKDTAFVKWFLDRHPECRVKTVVPTTITPGIELKSAV